MIHCIKLYNVLHLIFLPKQQVIKPSVLSFYKDTLYWLYELQFRSECGNGWYESLYEGKRTEMKMGEISNDSTTSFVLSGSMKAMGSILQGARLFTACS